MRQSTDNFSTTYARVAWLHFFIACLFAIAGCRDQHSGAANHANTPKVPVDSRNLSTSVPAQRPDVQYLGFKNRKTVTDELLSLETLTTQQVLVLQGALHSHGFDMLGHISRPLTKDDVVSSIQSHSKDNSLVKFKFKNGVCLTLASDRAETSVPSGGTYLSCLMEPLPPQGCVTSKCVDNVIRAVGSRFAVPLTESQRALLRQKLTTPGALLDAEEQVMEGDGNIIVNATELPSGLTRLEFFNGAILELSADGKVAMEFLPWQKI
jgi:hypothetical protein